MLTPAGCRTRQRRLLGAMERNGWDLFPTASYRTAYYLTGSLGPPEMPTIFLLHQGGQSALITSVKGDAAADDLVPLETYSIERSITHPAHDAARLLKEFLAGRAAWRAKSGAAERATVSDLFREAVIAASPDTTWIDASDAMLALRKAQGVRRN